MDDLANDPDFLRSNQNLEMLTRLEQPPSVRPAVNEVPGADCLAPISTDHHAPQTGPNQSSPILVWGLICKLKPSVGDFNSGIALVRRLNDSKLAVAKIMRPIDNILWTHQHWLREIQVTRACVHLNICAFIDAYYTPELAILYLEPCDLGNLKDLKENMDVNNQGLGQTHMLSILIQLTAALCYIHSGFDSYVQAANSVATQIPGRQIVLHTDIRPDQIFLKTPTHDQFPLVKLGDFGLAENVSHAAEKKRHWAADVVGKTAWRPPEWPLVSTATDVFALGTLTQYLATHFPIREIASRWSPLTTPLEVSPLVFHRRLVSAYNPALNRILNGCSRRAYGQRPSAQEVATELLAEQKRLTALGSIQRAEAIPLWCFQKACEPEVDRTRGVLPSIPEEGVFR